MKSTLWKWIAVVAAVTATLPAHARPGHRQMPERRAGEEQSVPPQRPETPRDMQRGEPQPPPGRMSPEERRQLRRDIDEAGRDLYRRNPPHPQP